MFVVFLACISKHLLHGNRSERRSVFVLTVWLALKWKLKTVCFAECYLSSIHKEAEATEN